MQGRRCDGGRRDDVVERRYAHGVSRDAPVTLPSFEGSLDRQW